MIFKMTRQDTPEIILSVCHRSLRHTAQSESRQTHGFRVMLLRCLGYNCTTFSVTASKGPGLRFVDSVKGAIRYASNSRELHLPGARRFTDGSGKEGIRENCECCLSENMIRKPPRRPRRTRPMPIANTSQAARARAVIFRSRQLLKPFAELPNESSIIAVEQLGNRIGGPEVLGALIRAAAIPAEGEHLSEADFVRFIAEATEVMDQLQSLTLNWSVINSLFLTIFVGMAVMHAGSPAYNGVDVQRAAFESSDDSAYAYGDLASLAWPDDADAAAGLRRAFYAAECSLTIVGIVLCLVSILTTVSIYDSLSVSLPNVVAKYELVVNFPLTMGGMWGSFAITCCIVLPLALAFATARASAMMSIATFAGFVLLNAWRMLVFERRGAAYAQYLGLWQEAKLVLGLPLS